MILKVDSFVVKLKILLDHSSKSSAFYLYYFRELKRKEYSKVDK